MTNYKQNKNMAYTVPLSECLNPDDEWTKTNLDRLSRRTFWSSFTACL